MSKAALDKIRSKIDSGQRLTKTDAMALFRSDDIFALGEMAAFVAQRHNDNRAHYVRNLHVNPTNLCVNRCRFCAFSRSEGEEGAYELSTDEIMRKIEGAMPIEELHIVGGLHPSWPLEHYTDMIKRVRAGFPALHIKAFTAAEIEYLARISGLSITEVLERLKDSGLDTMPGGGAEIFDDEVRGRLCPEKLSGQRWLDIMRMAHQGGIKTNATMLYGHLESHRHRVDHLMRLRALQDETHGFQAFIPLSYHPGNTDIGGKGASGLDDLKTIAISRLVLDNFPHIKAYWVMLGEKLSQVALLFGADDLDGTVLEEKITRSTDAVNAKGRSGITEPELIAMIRAAGKAPIRRDGFYKEVMA